jgi:two-component system OmpR family response regulator
MNVRAVHQGFMSLQDAQLVRILIVEDDLRLANMLRLGLEEDGFGVDLVDNGEDALAAATATPFDLVTVDVMLPGSIDGFAVCAGLRRRRIRTPVLMLTSRDAVEDRVRGLESGADDYLVKPFAFVEFLARLRALARRHLEDRSSVLQSGTLSLDTAARELRVKGRPIKLTSKELAIQGARHPGISHASSPASSFTEPDRGARLELRPPERLQSGRRLHGTPAPEAVRGQRRRPHRDPEGHGLPFRPDT